MQKRHFEMIACIINQMDVSLKEKLLFAQHFEQVLGDTYQNFDRDKFLKACIK